MSAHPFDRADAKTRRRMALAEAENWDEAAVERARRASEYEGARHVSALAHAEVARAKAAFARSCADAYARIALGKEPFEGSSIVVPIAKGVR